jgi:hypothetical protein
MQNLKTKQPQSSQSKNRAAACRKNITKPGDGNFPGEKHIDKSPLLDQGLNFRCSLYFL